ncbi:MAG: hypothetical protein OXU79_09480 [Gemmatimonadota bacterium]|nr:hypothetical protein [Gemmatimonadota bacterium]
MFKTLTRALLVGSAIAMTAGCADETQHQFAFRGKWRLESRQTPDGKILQPPAVSGHYEWYPTGLTTAHVTASISQGQNQIRVSGFNYSFQSEAVESQSFTRNEYMDVGGGYRTSPEESHIATGRTITGNMVVNGNRVSFENTGGATQVYADISIAVIDSVVFKVNFADGTMDTWRRFADQLGVLPK